ncbi:hypothetical protein [Bacteriovorax sp. BAL6_X]|uniref:hypothetical protein n=1 Tax=Bacteriovorax sp. BAL6_X TaxID=1201290 RepID=UPI0012ECD0D2|nr:hypothetical protein [Bacteriovorax sp. BAL6_X]
MKKISSLLFIVALSTQVFGMSLEEYNAQVDKINSTIKDEQMRLLVKQELAKEIAKSLSTQKVDEKEVEEAPAEVVEEESPKEVQNTQAVLVSDFVEEKDKFKFQLGINAIASTLDFYGSSLNLIGNELSITGVKKVDNHKFRLGLGIRSLKADTITLENGAEYNILNKIDYSGAGVNLSYTYMVTSGFGVGAYMAFNYGETDLCEVDYCYNLDTTISELGARIDFNLAAWNPYLTIGYSLYNIDGHEFDAASAYLGLLNFEF